MSNGSGVTGSGGIHPEARTLPSCDRARRAEPPSTIGWATGRGDDVRRGQVHSRRRPVPLARPQGAAGGTVQGAEHVEPFGGVCRRCRDRERTVVGGCRGGWGGGIGAGGGGGGGGDRTSS